MRKMNAIARNSIIITFPTLFLELFCKIDIFVLFSFWLFAREVVLILPSSIVFPQKLHRPLEPIVPAQRLFPHGILCFRGDGFLSCFPQVLHAA
jgi:hypothetical protein